MHEGGVRADRRRTMQVTLLRSVRRTVGTSGEVDGLERGEICYRFALLPYRGALPYREVFEVLSALESGIGTRQTGRFSSGYPAMTGKAEPRQSFVELRDGNLVLSCLKPAENGEGLIMRLWNPTAGTVEETIAFWRPVVHAEYCKLSEDRRRGPRPAVSGRHVCVKAPAHKILTLRVMLGNA